MALKRFILSLALLLPVIAQGQAHHEVGVMGGVSNYYGDLQDNLFPDAGYRPMGGISYKYFMSPHIGLRFGASYSALTAADSLSESQAKLERNLRFSTNLFEVHGGLELNLLPIDINRMKVTPYIFAGIGVFHYNPYTDGVLGEKVYLRPLSTEGQGLAAYPDRKEYSLVNVSFPIGGGLKFLVGKTLVITTELGFRYTNTDYLDDVSKSYVNLDTLFAYRGQQAVDMAYRGNQTENWDGNYPNYRFQRGDSKANDWYWYGGVGVAIYFEAFGNMSNYWQTNCPAIFRGRNRN